MHTKFNAVRLSNRTHSDDILTNVIKHGNTHYIIILKECSLSTNTKLRCLILLNVITELPIIQLSQMQ